jgi:hypothetical protein
MTLRCLAALLAVSIATPAFAMDFNCPPPGTTLEFDSGTKVVSKGKDGNDCLMEQVGGKPFRMRSLMFANPGPDGSDTTALINSLRPERLFPLAVGKRIEARHTSDKGSWNYVFSVQRTQMLEGVAGGAHETFLIEMTETAASGPYRAVARWWISPRFNYLLRYDFSDSDNRSNRALVTKVTN